MKLSERRWRFNQDIVLLQAYIMTKRPEVMACLNEVKRFEDKQKEYVEAGVSWTMDSKHLICMAADFDFYINGEWIGSLSKMSSKKLLQDIGDFWESLTPGNKWGGNWENVDVPHFEGP